MAIHACPRSIMINAMIFSYESISIEIISMHLIWCVIFIWHHITQLTETIHLTINETIIDFQLCVCVGDGSNKWIVKAFVFSWDSVYSLLKSIFKFTYCSVPCLNFSQTVTYAIVKQLRLNENWRYQFPLKHENLLTKLIFGERTNRISKSFWEIHFLNR